jgi:hypothetical protein
MNGDGVMWYFFAGFAGTLGILVILDSERSARTAK